MQTTLMTAILATALALGAAFAQHDHGGTVAEPAGTTDEHAGHDMGAMDGAAMASMPGNLIAVGPLLLELEPLLDVSGAFRMAVSTLTEEGPVETAFDLTITNPEGADLHLHGDHSLIVAELGQLQEGVWTIGGTIDGVPVQRSLSIVRSRTELDTDVVAIFTPTPTIEQGGISELFLYAISEGENIHSRFVLEASPAADDMAMGDGVDLIHDHFMDVYNSDGFTPMTNTVTLTFDTAGLWNFQLTIMGGFAQTADFDLAIQ